MPEPVLHVGAKYFQRLSCIAMVSGAIINIECLCSVGGGRRVFRRVALALGILPGLGARVALAEDTYTITVNGTAIKTYAELDIFYECAASENAFEEIKYSGIVSEARAHQTGATWFLEIKVNGEGQGSLSYTEGAESKRLSINCTKNVVPVSSVSLDPVTATLEVGKSQTLKPTILPANATDKTVTWTSDKPGVATVATDGTVTAVAAGTATITATATNGATDTADDKSQNAGEVVLPRNRCTTSLYWKAPCS